MDNQQTSMAFQIKGLYCVEEVTVLRRELGPLVGDESKLAFDVLNAKMTVAVDVSLSQAEVQAVVARTGMAAEPWQDDKTALANEGFWERNRRTLLTAVSGGSLLAGLGTHAALVGVRAAFLEESGTSGLTVMTVIFYLVSIVAGVWTVLPKTWIAAKRFRPDMNLLTVVTVVGAVSIGQWLEAATVAFLFAISLTLEAWSIGRARRAVAALMALSPPEARLIADDGSERKVQLDQVPVGGRFRVLTGDRFPSGWEGVGRQWCSRPGPDYR